MQRLDLAAGAGSGARILDGQIPVRHRGVAGIQHLPGGVVVDVGLGIVTEPLLGKEAVTDGGAALRARDVGRDANCFARDDIIVRVIPHVGNRIDPPHLIPARPPDDQPCEPSAIDEKRM